MSEQETIFAIDGHDYQPEHVGDIEAFPILMKMATERVFGINARAGAVEIREACDNYFSLDLTPDEAELLAAEIIAVAKMAREAE